MRTPGRARGWWWRRRHVLLPLALLLALWIPGANQGWYRTDTHYYAAIAKQAWDAALAQRSIAPLLDLRAGGEPYFNKPPLAFVIHGAFVEVFGLSLWSVRLPSLLAAMGAAWAMVAGVRRLGGWRLAMVAGITLATTVEFFRYTRAISLDLWVALWLMGGLWMVAHGVRRWDAHGADRAAVGRRGARGRALSWLVLSGVPIGLALLTKPVVGLAAPVIFGIWLAATGRSRLVWTMAAAGVVAFAVAAPWHVWMMSRNPGFALIYFKQQGLDRAISGHGAALGLDAGGASPAHAPEPWWYYAGAIARTYWPWLGALAAGLLLLASRRLSPTARVRDALTLSALWCGLWLAALSAFGGKSDRYLVVAWPLMGVLAGWWLARPAAGAGKGLGRSLMELAAPIALAVAIALAAAGVRVHAPRDPSWDELVRRLDAAPGAHLVTTGRGHSLGANLVMLGRAWPDKAPAAVSAGTWILSHPQEPDPPGSRVLMRSEELVLSERLPSSPDRKSQLHKPSRGPSRSVPPRL